MPGKFSTQIEVRFRYVDALGHVNNAVYFTYFETARMHYWKVMLGEGAFERYSYVIVRAECNFRSPSHMGETLVVSARISELKNSSFVFSYKILECDSQRLIADGTTVQACFDLDKKRVRSIPEELRARILEFES